MELVLKAADWRKGLDGFQLISVTRRLLFNGFYRYFGLENVADLIEMDSGILCGNEGGVCMRHSWSIVRTSLKRSSLSLSQSISTHPPIYP